MPPCALLVPRGVQVQSEQRGVDESMWVSVTVAGQTYSISAPLSQIAYGKLPPPFLFAPSFPAAAISLHRSPLTLAPLYGAMPAHPGAQTPIRGGLLAEAMGLGKTVICLGAIILNPSPIIHNGLSFVLDCLSLS